MAKRKKFDISAEGDMTPMIDMTFQLIAFFMVLINFADGDQDQRIKLPSSELAKPPDAPIEAPLILQLTEQGLVLMGGDKVPIADMPKYLRTEAEIIKRQEKPVGEVSVIIRADRGTKTGLVQELIKKCQEQKFEKFALRAKQEARAP
jgi:biopolymer transport protein ExbD